MTPQSTFMVMAPVADGRLAALRTMLASMTTQPGMADPDNVLVPFGSFERLHVARVVILQSNTAADIATDGPEPSYWPPTLVLLGDCDGPSETFIAELAVRAAPGLRQIFSCCEGFVEGEQNLVAWMQARNVAPNANYINWVGRTVLQIRQEARLHQALSQELRRLVAEIGADDCRALRQRLLTFVELEQHQGRLPLTPPEPTPTVWWLKSLLHKLGVPVLLLAATPLVVLAAPYLILRLRTLERSDPEVPERPDRAHIDALARLEDWQITNQFSAFGVIKPQRFRRVAVRVLLFLLDYAIRHVYNRGFLTRVQTIHFARWVVLDGGRRVFFASNYDGSLESYMDDFINKVAWGLNLVFSNGLGYPSTRWLIKDGAEQEQKFKNFLRRRQLPTEVWYKAYPGKSAFDLSRNSRVREGVENRQSSDDAIRAWLALLQA